MFGNILKSGEGERWPLFFFTVTYKENLYTKPGGGGGSLNGESEGGE